MALGHVIIPRIRAAIYKISGGDVYWEFPPSNGLTTLFHSVFVTQMSQIYFIHSFLSSLLPLSCLDYWNIRYFPLFPAKPTEDYEC